MPTRKPAKQRGQQGERVDPEPRLVLPKPGSECSTPELASKMPQELLSALGKLGRKRKAEADDDAPEAA